MAKKTTKKDINETVLTGETITLKINGIVNTTEEKEEVISNDKEYENNLDDISIMDLISYEKACALICKKYERAAHIDMAYNEKLKVFSSYYEKIFNKLETLVESKFK